MSSLAKDLAVYANLLLLLLGGVTVGCLDFWSGRCQLVIAWIGDCLPTGKPSQYITNTKVNSAFHLSGVGKLSTGLSGWC